MILFHRVVSLLRTRPRLAAISALWAMMWMSINAESALQNDDFFSSLHAYRLLLPYFSASVAFFWLLYLRVKPKIEFWQLALIGYAGLVLGRGFFLGTPFIALHFHAAILCTIIVVILCTTMVATDNTLSFRDVVLTLFLTNFLFLCLLLLVFLPRDVFHSILFQSLSGYVAASKAFSQTALVTVLGMESPRPTGVSRLAAVAMLFIFAAYRSGVWRSRLAKTLIYFGIAVVVYYQARGTAMALVAVGLFLLTLIARQDWPKLHDIVRFFLGTLLACIIIVAVILSGIFVMGALGNSAAVNDGSIQHFSNLDTIQFSRELVSPEAGSGRLRHWAEGWNAFLTSPIFGLGGQADRFYIDHNVSNIFIYSLMCGGLVGSFFAVLAVAPALRTVWTFVNRRYVGVQGNEQLLLLTSLTIFAFLSARGFVENSYALFNIDFLLVIPTIWYLSTKSRN